jgi:hypothetical protein
MPARSFKPFVFGVATGLTAMALLGRGQGRRNRALVRDKARHYARVLPRRFRRWERGVEGQARGAMHAVDHALGGAGRLGPDHDQYIKERVQSELGHVPGLPLSALNFDAADGIVRVRGVVRDAAVAQRILDAAAEVDGVREVISLLHTADGTPVGTYAGEPDVYGGEPRAAVYADAVRLALLDAFPGLTDADIIASDGHAGRLAAIVQAKTGRDADEVRHILDAIVLAAV